MRTMEEHSSGQTAAACAVPSLAGGLPVPNPVIFKASLGAVLNLLYVGVIGAIAGHLGVLDQAKIRCLSELVYSIAQPAFLFVSVAETISTTPGGLSLLAPLPVFAVLQILIGKRCEAFIAFYLLGWSPFLWSLGYNILADDRDKVNNKPSWSGVLREARDSLVRPPVLGCLAGALAGGLPWTRSFFFANPSCVVRPLVDAVRNVGSLYLPAVLLTLAGSLYRGFAQGGFRVNAFQLPAVALARFGVMPAITFAVVRLAQRTSLIQADPVLMFLLLLEGCMPPAQNTVVILQKQGQREEAESMAQTLAAIYALSLVPLPFLISCILDTAGVSLTTT
ncbi:unnamed protein product [Vitrella brassicaformis CCMP3155]|uniref:Uncharacterized protein n=1 Tax=Vitrella brassicaformis (strain CCMP3155) TaxID=1169540 RepID=A0A0G4EE60_VITBC|nr:unnamed protein product [Vitrella brassicaformis CCMP3155]|eukprot:CEL93843.1 unnamed protein product [Vitrella brassicaformis CCMP3155]